MLPVTRSLLPTVSRFFDDDWNNLFDWSHRNFSSMDQTLPSVNIIETGDAYMVEMAAPGMKKDDFQIELHRNVLTIKCETKEDLKEEDRIYTRREFYYNGFQRTFNLNKEVVDDGNIKASYQDGLLTIHLPKKEEVKEKPARLIEIV